MASDFIPHGSKSAFLRFQRQGFPIPNLAAEIKIKKLLKKEYEKIVRELLRTFRQQAEIAGINAKRLITDSAGNDDFQETMSFLEQIEQEAKENVEKANLKASLASVRENLKNDQTDEIPNVDLLEILEKIFFESQSSFSKKFGGDAGDTMQRIIKSFSIDKRKLYNDNMAEIRRLYIDNSMRRIAGEKDLLKRKLLQKIDDYVVGKSDVLDIRALTKQMLGSSARMARFFARDQLSRLNKATAIATFVNAGVTKVKWVTAHDVRVRSTHAVLDGQIFDINALPDEVDDYNCRCALVPVEYAE